MKLNKRRIVITLGTVIPVVSLAVALPVAIFVFRDEEGTKKNFKVNLASDSAERYFITKMNPQQNKPNLADVNVWDINTDTVDSDLYPKIKSIIGLSEDSPNTYVIGTISSGKNYKNGLEKFIVDLIQMVKNANDVTLVFASGEQNEITLSNFPNLTKQERYNEIIENINNHDLSYDYSKDEDNLTKNLHLMINKMLEIKIVDFDKKEVRDTTLDDIKNSIEKMVEKISDVEA